jgi:hypothetical protein
MRITSAGDPLQDKIWLAAGVVIMENPEDIQVTWVLAIGSQCHRAVRQRDFMATDRCLLATYRRRVHTMVNHPDSDRADSMIMVIRRARAPAITSIPRRDTSNPATL